MIVIKFHRKRGVYSAKIVDSAKMFNFVIALGMFQYKGNGQGWLTGITQRKPSISCE